MSHVAIKTRLNGLYNAAVYGVLSLRRTSGRAMTKLGIMTMMTTLGGSALGQTAYMVGGYNVYNQTDSTYEPANLFVDTFNPPYNTIYVCDIHQQNIVRIVPGPPTSVGQIASTQTTYSFSTPSSGNQGACAIDHNLDLFIIPKVAPTGTSTDAVNLYWLQNHGTVATPSYPTNAGGTAFGTTGLYATAITLGSSGSIISFGTSGIASYGSVDGNGNVAVSLNFQITGGSTVQGGILLESPQAGLGSSYASPTEQIIGAYGAGATPGQTFLLCGSTTCAQGANNIQFDSNNNIYVTTNSTNHAVMKGVPMTSTTAATNCPTIAGTQYYVGGAIVAGNSVGYCVTKLAATVATPSGVTATPSSVVEDANGNLYIASPSTNLVLKESPTTTPGTYAQSVLMSYPGSTSATTSTVPGYFSPAAVGLDGNGTLSITEGASTNDYGLQLLNVGPVNFGNITVGTTVGEWIAFTFNATSTLGSIPVVATTQGGGTDFAYLGSQTVPTAIAGYFEPTCTAGTTYTVGAITSSTTVAYTCVAYVTFTPSAAGVRNGVIQLIGAPGTSANGTSILATGYISGTGVAAKVNFLPGTESTVAKTTSSPAGIAADASGNVYVANPGAATVTKETYVSGTYTGSLIGSGLSAPNATAVDAVGNVYIADTGNNRVLIETLAGSNYTQSVLPTSALKGPSAIAVDSFGNVYIADTGNNRALVETVQPGIGAYEEVVVATGLGAPTGIAADASGDIYISNTTNNSVIVEIPSSNTYNNGIYKQVTVATSPLSSPAALTVDSFGDLFIVDKGNNRVLREASPSSGNLSESVVGSSALNLPAGVATTSNGNLYLSDGGNDRVLEEDLSDAPSLTFAAQSGATSYTQAVTVENVGSATLNFLVPSTGLNPALSDLVNFNLNTTGSSACPSISTSSKAGTLASNATCQLPVSFTPGSVNTFNATLGITDNNSGASTATQTIKLTGTSTADVEAIFWAPTTSISYGTTLANLLNAYAYDGAVSNIPGTFSYTYTLAGGQPVAATATTTLVPGSYTLTATFTPTNTTTYTTLTATSPLNVAPGQPTITWSESTFTLVTPTPLGTNLPTTATFNGTAVAGTFTYSAKNTTTGTSTSASAATVLPLGTYLVTATFTPSSPALYAAVAATATVNEVLPTPTITWANATPAPIAYGTALGSILSVTAAYGTTNVPGTATFSDGAPVTGASVLTGGTYTLTATFTPTNTSAYQVATSSISLTVTPISATAITLVASTLDTTVSNADGLSATVVGPYATPTGTVQFLLGTTGNPILLGTGTLSSGGTVTCYTSSGSNTSCTALIGLQSGTDSLTALYSGDSNYHSLSSSAVSILVQDFQLSPTQATAVLPPYGQANYTFNFTPLNGSTFPIAVNWTVTGAPTGATVTVTPITFAAGSGPATITVSVAELPVGELHRPQIFGRYLPVSACLLLLPFAVGWRRSFRKQMNASNSRRLLSALLFAILAGGSFLGLNACGTAITTNSASQYYITLTGTAGNLVHAVTVNLNVESN